MTPTATLKSVLAATLVLGAVAACSPSSPPASTTEPKVVQTMPDPMPTQAPAPAMASDVVTAAAADPQFSTLVAAINAAGLADALKGPGPFTVFAPTNEAFAKLPAGTVEGLLKPGKKADLTKILQYHVVPGRILAADVGGLKQTPATLEGKTLRIDTSTAGVVKINGATVTKTDIVTGNGVIHVIDTVLLP